MTHHRRPTAGPAVAALVLTLFATVVIPGAGIADAQETAGGGPTFTSTPGRGPTGTEVSLSGADCFLPGSATPGDGVVVTLVHEGTVAADATLRVNADGSWNGTLTVPAGTATAAHKLEAVCASPGFEDTDPVTYARRTFDVTGAGTEAASAEAIDTPAFNGGIEDFADYDGQSTCSPSTKPGMGAFVSMVLSGYGGRDTGVGRTCNVGGTSEHKEGRAWDWGGNNAGSAADRARVQSLFDWLFATDANCNTFANARRLGIMYIIWNRQMFRMYDTDSGWTPYSGSSPHTDHVHFSMTRAGGAGQTSYFTRSFDAPSFSAGDRETRGISINPVWAESQSGDFNGDGRDDLLWYRPGAAPDYVWFGTGQGDFSSREISVSRAYRPLVGDFNADCVADVFWYGPGDEKDYLWTGHRNGRFSGSAVDASGTYDRPMVADFNGDRAEDILWYQPGTGPDAIWYGSIYGRFTGRSATINGTYEPLVGDFDGDGPADVLFHGAGNGADSMWYGTRSAAFTSRSVSAAFAAGPHRVGDFNGDQREDVFWYGPGDVSDAIWLGTANRGFLGKPATMSGTFAFPAAGDFDGNGQDDIVFHGDGTDADRMWLFR